MSLQHSSDDKIQVIRTQPHQSLGCAIIDAKGREVPITEDMIQSACRDLEQRLVKPAEHK
ncbi:PA1571 family protein [Pseudomonas sp. RA_35y_Pfl2_P32]|uniref:PA1571 family protein n=1 Tax=Pseudomonas sp. RA_35y_Pfl2_P32 TaxID=3088705 RepID=UPI0030DC17F1